MSNNGMTTCAYDAALERESVPRPCHGMAIPGTTGPRGKSRSSPSGWLRRCGSAMLLPLTLLGGSVRGRRARRRRMVHGVIALLLAVLMIAEGAIPSLRVGLAITENVQAMHAQAMLRQAVGSAVLGSTTPTDYTYGYDANGNLTSISDGQNANTYVYDAENRMILADIRIGGVSTTAYGYDADGVRTYKTDKKTVNHTNRSGLFWDWGGRLGSERLEQSY